MKINRIAFASRLAMFGLALTFGVHSSLAQQTNVQNRQGQRPAHHAVDLTVVNSEAVGFSSERLERLHKLLQQIVDQKQIAGMVTILARHGKVVD